MGDQTTSGGGLGFFFNDPTEGEKTVRILTAQEYLPREKKADCVGQAFLPACLPGPISGRQECLPHPEDPDGFLGSVDNIWIGYEVWARATVP